MNNNFINLSKEKKSKYFSSKFYKISLYIRRKLLQVYWQMSPDSRYK